jgi:hypothetical protein
MKPPALFEEYSKFMDMDWVRVNWRDTDAWEIDVKEIMSQDTFFR